MGRRFPPYGFGTGRDFLDSYREYGLVYLDRIGNELIFRLTLSYCIRIEEHLQELEGMVPSAVLAELGLDSD